MDKQLDPANVRRVIGVRRLWLACALVAALPAQDPATIQETAQRVAREHACETTLPDEGLPSSGTADSERESGRDTGSEWNVGVGGFGLELGTGFASTMAWVLIGVLVVLLVVGLIATWAHPAPRAAPAAAAPGSRVRVRELQPAASPDLPDWRAAAAAGDHAEALHAMLLHAIARLAMLRGSAFPRAATAREVLRLAGESHRARLWSCLTLGERARYGGQQIDAGEFADCRSRFEEWEAACGRPAS